MTDHKHDFGVHEISVVRMCAGPDCVEWRVGIKGGWRTLTAREQTDATMIMLEDLIMVDAMSVVHGKDRGPARYNYLRYGGPSADA